MITHADCLDFLQTVPTQSVDLVLTDPPYAIGVADWDKQWASEAEYLDWCRLWTTECVRVLKPNRMFVVFGTFKTDTFLRFKLDVLNQLPLTPQNEIIWSYNWGGRTSKNFARKHEVAWCYSTGKDFYFDADAVRVERKQKTNIRTGLPFERGTIPTCVWEHNNHTTSKEYVDWHPTQKPLFVLERLIRAYTRQNETVLDIFSGSGSTAIAADQTLRQFIGCENNFEYYIKSNERRAMMSSVPLF